ncbi:MAG: prenyltransferase/squalene oxidase repeat-containing protein [Planctomycetota bacterium]|jgi:hypothetical protein
MRFWSDHAMEGDSFQDSLRGIVRGTPWWSLSACIHIVALLVLAAIPIDNSTKGDGVVLQAEYHPDEEKPLEDEVEPPKPPKEDPVDAPVIDENIDDIPTEDTDSDFDELEGVEGETSGPLTGPSFNVAIGIGPGAGGGKGRGSGRRRPGGRGRPLPGQPQVAAGLEWLANHQDLATDGKWDCDDFMKHDPPDDRCDGPGNQLYDVGVTGLALLAFLGANYTDRGGPETPYAANVRAGLKYLIRQQDEDGCFGTRSSKHFLYNHAIATLAMAEAYWMTRNVRYKRPAQKGLDFISMARNPYLAWRYEPQGGENDLSMTGWMIMALKSGKYAGLLIDPDAFAGARRFVDKMTDPEFGAAGYDTPGGGPARPEGLQDRFPMEKSRSMTAVAILTRIFLGEEPSSDMVRKGADLCLECLPTWNEDDGSIDMYYWYYGSLALFQVGGTRWKKWKKAMVPTVVKSQHARGSGSRTGSWDPIGPWGHDGGRVYSTALQVMCLEVFYRYDRVFGLRRDK